MERTCTCTQHPDPHLACSLSPPGASNQAPRPHKMQGTYVAMRLALVRRHAKQCKQVESLAQTAGQLKFAASQHSHVLRLPGPQPILGLLACYGHAIKCLTYWVNTKHTFQAQQHRRAARVVFCSHAKWRTSEWCTTWACHEGPYQHLRMAAVTVDV
jgi:hypothetical protein